MPRKNLKVISALNKIGQYLEEARLKRNLSSLYLSKYLNIAPEQMNDLENTNSKISIFSFFKYICYLNFDETIIEQIKKSNKKILFELHNYKIVKSKLREVRFLNKLVAYLILIRKFNNINENVIADRSGIAIEGVNKIENCEDVPLIDFLAYCNAIGVLDRIVDSLSFKFDEIGNMLIIKKLKENS